MAAQHSLDVARRAQHLYEQTLRHDLETNHRHSYVAIEPESGEYFLGPTLSNAVQAARIAHPDRISFAIWIGHPTTVSLGVLSP